MNITTQIEDHCTDEWIQWQRENNIPEFMDTGYFSSYSLYRLLGHDEEGVQTYVLQLFINTQQNYHDYIAHHEEIFLRKAHEKWKDKSVHFITLLEKVDS